MRELRKDTFVVRTDSQGNKYVTTTYNEMEKNHNGVDPKVKDATKLMFEQKDDPKCPVRSFTKYLSKLNPNCEAFFQRPKTKFVPEGIWYDNVPLEKTRFLQN